MYLFFLLSRKARNTCSTLLNQSHWVKMPLCGRVWAFLFLCHSLVIWRKFWSKSWFNRSTSNWTGLPKWGTSLRSNFLFLNLPYQSRFFQLWHPLHSIMSKAVFALEYWLKGIKEEVVKMLIFLLIFHLNMIWKLTEINSN